MVKFIASEISAQEGAGGNLIITIAAPLPLAGHFENIKGEYLIEIKKHRQKRSLNANALFWKVCGSMAEILRVSDEDIYLQLLERYGVKKYIVVKPEAVESVKGLFRAVDEMGSVYVDGKRGVQLRCTIGSSQYDTKQMGRLIDGAITESKDIGAWVPDEQDIGAALDLWQKERE